MAELKVAIKQYELLQGKYLLKPRSIV